MDIWQMKYFIQIYQDKSLTKAAKNLYISQQGLSKTLLNIEAELQIPLFDRMVKGLRPTKYGELLYIKSKKIVNEYNEMIETINNEIISETSTITIGIANIIYTDSLKAISSKFQMEHPNITLNFLEFGYYTCEKYLENNLVDICFSIKPENLKLNYIPIMKCKLILLVNKKNPLSQKPVVNFIDLKEERFIMFPTDSKIRKLIVDHCLRSGFNPNIVITASQLDFITELIDLNIGIAILPDYTSIKALEMSDNITVTSFEDSTFEIEAGYITNKNSKPNHITKTLIEYFKNTKN